MRLSYLIFVLFAAASFALVSCVPEEPQCDYEDGEVSCTCDDGTEGYLECNDDGTANCVCDENDTNNTDSDD